MILFLSLNIAGVPSALTRGGEVDPLPEFDVNANDRRTGVVLS
jgi:hypothetical protein